MRKNGCFVALRIPNDEMPADAANRFPDLPAVRLGLHYGIRIPACFFFGFFPARIRVLHADSLIRENALPVHRIAGWAEDGDMGCPFLSLSQLNAEIFNLVSAYMFAWHFALRGVINGIGCGIIVIEQQARRQAADASCQPVRKLDLQPFYGGNHADFGIYQEPWATLHLHHRL